MVPVRTHSFSRAVDAIELSSQRENNLTFKFHQSCQETGSPWSPEKQSWLERVMEWIRHMSAEQQDILQQGPWIKRNPNKLNDTEASLPGRVWVQYMIGSSFILCTRNSDGKAVIYTRWMWKTTYTTPLFAQRRIGACLCRFWKAYAHT